MNKSLARLGAEIRKLIVGTTPNKGKDADTVGGLTASQISSGTTKADVGLGSVENLPTKRTWTNGETPTSAFYTTPLVAWGIFRQFCAKLVNPAGSGSFLYIRNDGSALPLESDTFLSSIAPCMDDNEMNLVMASKTQHAYNVSTRRLMVLSGGAYTQAAPADLSNYIKPNRWHYNKTTTTLYYSETVDSFIAF